MLKKTITYTDFDDNERTEDFYFYLSKAEVIQWLTSCGTYTLDKLIMRLWKERNGGKIIEIFGDLIDRAYGEKSDDGRTFDKSDEILRKFKGTEAYSEIFSEIVTDAEKAAEFVNAIVPKEMANEIAKAMKENPDGIPAEMKDYMPKSDENTNVTQFHDKM